MTSKGVKTTHPTVIKVLEAFESAYLFFRANRYDMRGKQYLETNAKYYIADNYQKIIITRQLSDKIEVDGIPVLQIEDWLLQA